MKLGYARISTADQNLDSQVRALKKHGCDQIFTDKASGAKSERPGLINLFKFLREGDTLVVWKLDRLGRSLSHLIHLMQKIERRNAYFYSMTENIDTSTSMGKLLFHFISSLAEFERNIIRERSKAGLVAARARGRFGGRQFKLNKEQVHRLKELHANKINTIPELCQMFSLTKQSLYNYLNGRSVPKF